MSACELSVGWLIATFIIGTSFGACVGTVVAALCRVAAIDPPDDPPEPIGAYDLDDPLQRRRFEESLARRNGGLSS
jgi:hypothetical protein